MSSRILKPFKALDAGLKSHLPVRVHAFLRGIFFTGLAAILLAAFVVGGEAIGGVGGGLLGLLIFCGGVFSALVSKPARL